MTLVRVLLPLLFSGCVQTPAPKQPTPHDTAQDATPPSNTVPQSQPEPPQMPSEEGLASYYADKLQGRKTASGEPYDKSQLTCAHRTFPFGTELTVERLDTGARTTCRVNDRGPGSPKRIVDLSRAAAEQLDLIGPGVTRVRLWVKTPAPAPRP